MTERKKVRNNIKLAYLAYQREHFTLKGKKDRRNSVMPKQRITILPDYLIYITQYA